MSIFALTDAFSVTTLNAVVSGQIKWYDALLEGSRRRRGPSNLVSSLFTFYTVDILFSSFGLFISSHQYHLICVFLIHSYCHSFCPVSGTRGRGKECLDGKR